MGLDDLDAFMAGVRTVESHGDYRARNPSGASGAYQFLDSTWNGYGGYARAMDAPPAVQDRRAELLMTRYYHRYHRWDLVAVAWHGGPGLADRARRDPGLPGRISDGHITTAEFVRRVLAAAHLPRGRGGHRDHGHHRPELAPWRLPNHGQVRGRTVAIDPGRLHRLAGQLTEHLAAVDSAYRRSRRAAEDLDGSAAARAGLRVEVAEPGLEARLRQALHLAVEDWHGLRRLPHLFTRDIGYVVEVRRRVLHADRGDARRTIEGLIGALARHADPRIGAGTRRHVAALMRHLFPPRPNSSSPSLGHVHLGPAWAGTESIFDQFVTPFLRARGLRPGYEKWLNPNLASDHRPEHRNAYAIDYPTRAGLDDARALARSMGITGWQPDTYQHHVVTVQGQQFRVQILWGARIDHADHVHVGIRRI